MNRLIRSTALIAATILLAGIAEAEYAATTPTATRWDGARLTVTHDPVFLTKTGDPLSGNYLQVDPSGPRVIYYDANTGQTVDLGPPSGATSEICPTGWYCKVKDGNQPTDCRWIRNWWDPQIVSGYTIGDFAYGRCASTRASVDNGTHKVNVQYRPAIRLSRPQLIPPPGNLNTNVGGEWAHGATITWLTGTEPALCMSCENDPVTASPLILSSTPGQSADCKSADRVTNVADAAQFVDCVWSASVVIPLDVPPGYGIDGFRFVAQVANRPDANSAWTEWPTTLECFNCVASA